MLAVALAFPDGSFDLVLCQQRLQFFPDRLCCAKCGSSCARRRVALSVWQSLEHNPVYQALTEAAVRHLGVPTAA
jgi:hypothetical protein